MSNYLENVYSTPESGRVSSKANSSTGRKTLLQFLYHVDQYGIQVQNNFEVVFHRFENNFTFFVNSIELPGSRQNTCEVFYDGIKILIPVNYEHDHEFSMTLLNDANGYVYTLIKTWIEFDSYNHYTDPGSTMLIKALTGQIYADGNNQYDGSRIYCKGVRFTSISGLSYGQGNNDIQTFTVQGTLIEYSHLPYSLSFYN